MSSRKLVAAFVTATLSTNDVLSFEEDKLLIRMPATGRHVRPATDSTAETTPDQTEPETDDGTSWLQITSLLQDIEILESSGKSYSEEQMIQKVREMYAIAKEVAEANNQPEWLYQRLVDAVLTQLKHDVHMLVFVGENHEQSWQKAPVNIIPDNYRKNYKAPPVERTNFRVTGSFTCF